ncbi:carbohydrate ABC transporter substrate-binding protein [Sporosarcina sp. ANT_H38]|uniref:ABC transporter substrate-binding protein n=1 Tax=Sporosarcina sp. ANT_H38 TaxID=2597358 RepID=UPI0011F3EF11|nr:ABC transporter substrate-binding protein [Sporosarcina sp. ANT_H38]KAA0965598.1 carbohydrate ABC transporter substrate-binding protein [Sporosarcina sp. ANT_H38]
MKKIFMLFLISILLVACSSSPDSKGSESKGGNEDTDEVTVWAWDPKFNIAALEIAKETYKQENPDLTVKIIENAQDDIIQKLNTALGSGTTKGLPNIVLIEDYRAQSFLKSFPDLFYELTDSFNASDFAEYKIAPTSSEGKNYGLPFDTGVTGLYVRTDYLKEAGYSVEDLEGIDWREYIEIGKKVKEVTGKTFLTIDPNDLGLIRVMIQSAGSWYVKEDGVTPNLVDNAALKEAFEVYKEMIDTNILKPHSDWNQFLTGFNSGDVVTVPTGNWITPSIKAEESQSGKWAVVPIPKLNVPGGVNASNLGGSSWYVLNIPGAEQAADFLGKTFGSNSEMYEKLVSEVGAIGTYKPAAENDAYAAEDKFFSGQKTIANFASWMEEIPGINYGMHTYAIDDIITVEMQNYLNGKDIDSVLSNAQKQAEAQLN